MIKTRAKKPEKLKTDKPYLFLLTTEQQEKIKELKRNGVNIPKLLRAGINSAFEDLKA